MAHVVSNWIYMFSFCTGRPYNKNTVNMYNIWYHDGSKNRSGFNLSINGGKSDTIFIQETNCEFDVHDAYKFIKCVGKWDIETSINTASIYDTVPWLRCDARVIVEGGNKARVLDLSVMVDIMYFANVHVDSLSMLCGMNAFIEAVSVSYSSIEIATPNPMTNVYNEHSPFLTSKCDCFHDKDKYITHVEDTISFLASTKKLLGSIHGVYLPFYVSKDNMHICGAYSDSVEYMISDVDPVIMYVDTTERSIETSKLSHIMETWLVKGCVAQVPLEYNVYNRHKYINCVGPKLVVTSHAHLWEADISEDVVVVCDWSDIEREMIASRIHKNSTVVVDSMFYTSTEYDDYLNNISSVLVNDYATARCDVFMKSMFKYFRNDSFKKNASFMNPKNIVIVNTARRMKNVKKKWDTYTFLHDTRGVPFEILDWGTVIWEDVRGIPNEYMHRIGGMHVGFHIGFTVWSGGINTPESAFMKHVCICNHISGDTSVANHGHGKVYNGPNASDLCAACFIPSDLQWLDENFPDVIETKVDMNHYELYMAAKIGKEISDLDDNDISSTIVTAAQNVQTNSGHNFVLCKPSEVKDFIEGIYDKEIENTRKLIEENQRSYESDLLTFELHTSLPVERSAHDSIGTNTPNASVEVSGNTINTMEFDDTDEMDEEYSDEYVENNVEERGDDDNDEEEGDDDDDDDEEEGDDDEEKEEEVEEVDEEKEEEEDDDNEEEEDDDNEESNRRETIVEDNLRNIYVDVTNETNRPGSLLDDPIRVFQNMGTRLVAISNSMPHSTAVSSNGNTHSTTNVSNSNMPITSSSPSVYITSTRPFIVSHTSGATSYDSTDRGFRGSIDFLHEIERQLSEGIADNVRVPMHTTHIQAYSSADFPDIISQIATQFISQTPLNTPTLNYDVSGTSRTAPSVIPLPTTNNSIDAAASQHQGRYTESMEKVLRTKLTAITKLKTREQDLRVQKARNVSLLSDIDAFMDELCSVCMTEKCQVVIPCMHPMCVSCMWKLFTMGDTIVSKKAVVFATCPLCKTNIESRHVYCPFVSECETKLKSSSCVNNDNESKTEEILHESKDACDVRDTYISTLSSLVDSKTYTLVYEMFEWLDANPESKCMVVVSSNNEVQNMTLGIYYSNLYEGRIDMLNTRKIDYIMSIGTDQTSDTNRHILASVWTDGNFVSGTGYYDSKVYIVHKRDLPTFPVHVVVNRIYTTFRVSERLEEFTFYRHYIPANFKLPSVHSFYWR